MKSLFEDFDLKARLRESLTDQLDAGRAYAGAREQREAQQLLEKTRDLLRQLQSVLSGRDDDPAIQAALDWCVARRRAERRAADLRQRADTIYNAYYTHDGIQNGLLALEEYAGDEAGDIDDPDAMYMKIYTDRLRILRFLYDKLMEGLAAQARDAEAGAAPEELTESQLEVLGWTPMEADLRRTIQTLQTYADGDVRPSLQRSKALYELGGKWEELREQLRQNMLALKKPLPEAAPAGTEAEGPLLAAMTRVMTGGEFDGLTRRSAAVEEYLSKLDAFVALARGTLLDPFDRS